MISRRVEGQENAESVFGGPEPVHQDHLAVLIQLLVDDDEEEDDVVAPKAPPAGPFLPVPPARLPTDQRHVRGDSLARTYAWH